MLLIVQCSCSSPSSHGGCRGQTTSWNIQVLNFPAILPDNSGEFRASVTVNARRYNKVGHFKCPVVMGSYGGNEARGMGQFCVVGKCINATNDNIFSICLEVRYP